MADSAATHFRAPLVGEAPHADAQDKAKARRKQLFLTLGAVVLTAAAAASAYWLLVASHHEVTDNAYVGADSATLTPQVAGQVVKVNVIDTQPVKQGDVLVQLDDRARSEERGAGTRKIRRMRSTSDPPVAAITIAPPIERHSSNAASACA